MCVLDVNNVNDAKPLIAKYCIVVLWNVEDRLYQKSQSYAPVLKYISLRLLTTRSVREKHILQQGDCKNKLWNETLPDNKVTVICPPNGDPAFNTDAYWMPDKTIYVLQHHPHHWYNMIKGILLKMGLNPSPQYPCLLYGTLTKNSCPNDSQQSTSQLHVGLYVNDFFLYSSDPLQEEIFKTLIQYHIKVDFMGNVNHLLVKYFDWITHKDGNVSVHISQS